MTTLYLIRGVCGSGKSTFATELYQAGIVSAVLEADQHFIDPVTGEYKFDANQLAVAHVRCQQRCIEYLIEGKSVAVSNTSTTEREVHTYKEIAERIIGCKFVSIVVESRHSGKNQHGVPEEKVQQMRNRFSVKL